MLRAGEAYWHCLNRACERTLPAAGLDCEAEIRLCICGSPMKRQTQPAVFSYLDFLREEPADDSRDRIGKEQGPCER